MISDIRYHVGLALLKFAMWLIPEEVKEEIRRMLLSGVVKFSELEE